MKGQLVKSGGESRLNELALASGGRPAFAEPICVGIPNVGNRNKLSERINTALETRRLSNDGPFCREFERRVADYLGVRHCIATSSATRAIEILAAALDLSGEVIVPSLTFVATAHALQWRGVRPVFCDVEPETLTLDPARVETLISPQTTAILGVHLWGRACPVDDLQAIAGSRDLKLIFDAAHAFGCSYKSRMLGSFGEAEVLSFHATKILNTFEGGAIVTNRDELAVKARRMRNFGIGDDGERIESIGTNGKMNEISAAMGLTALESIDEFIETNRRNYEQYRRELRDLNGVRLRAFDERERNNYHFIVISIDEAQAGLTRDQLMKVLHAENVMARRYFHPGCHRAEPYRSLYPDAGKRLPITEIALERLLALPTASAVDAEKITRICRIIALALEHAAEIRDL